MAPGTWAQVAASNQDAVLGSQNGNSGSMINYCQSMPWNPVAKRIEFTGADHDAVPATQRYARYDDASNTFSLVAVDAGFGAAVGTAFHGAGLLQANPYTGELFNAQQPQANPRLFRFYKMSAGSTTFSLVGTAPSGYLQIFMPSCWWTGPFTARALGSQGAYMCFNSGASQGIGTGEIFIYDPTIPGFLPTLTGVTDPVYTSNYAPVMAYSKIKNCAVYGGTSDVSSPNAPIAYRLNSDGTHTLMPPVPGSGMGLDVGALVADPVTGNFLLLTNGQLWELNPTGSGTWALQTGSRVPPSGVRNPTEMGQGLVVTAIPDYGVVAVTSQLAGSGGTFFLYKHA